MHRCMRTLVGASWLAPALLIVALAPKSSLGDEPTSRFGRLFRFGSSSSSKPSPTATSTRTTTPSLLPSSAPPSTAAAPSLPASSLPVANGVSTPSPTITGNTPAPRLLPQPRVSRAITESDPILTRTALVRSADGSQFAMFLQIYADGTVIDGSGVHHLGRESIKPIVETIESGELFRLRGHCGAPATDSTEQVHMVVFERNLGRLRANAFSYSGNPQGCENVVKHFHNLLETLQTKITPNPVADSPATSVPAGATAPFASGVNAIPLVPAVNP